MRISKTSCATLALIVLGCLGLAACGSSVATPRATATPALTAAQIISKAQDASPKAASYTSDISTTTSGKTTDLQTKVSFTSTPKRIHTVLTTTDAAGKTSTLETIQDDQNSYLNIEGKWLKTPNTTPVDISSLDLTKSLYSSILNPTLVGVETVNGIATYHLTATANQTGTTGKADFWVRQDNFYPVKLTAKSSGGAQGEAIISVNYTAWDDQVKIDLPTV